MEGKEQEAKIKGKWMEKKQVEERMQEEGERRLEDRKGW